MRMRTICATGILVALISATEAIYPFGLVRDINVITLGWNTSSPTIAREPIPPSPLSPPAPLPLPRLNPPGRRQDGARYADLPTIPAPGMPNRPHPGHGTQAEEGPNNGEIPPKDVTPTSTQPLLYIATEAPVPTPISGGAKTPEDRSTAMAGLVIALGVAVALLA